MNDEIAHDIARELRLIREELQKLNSAVKSIASRPQNSNKFGKSYQGRNSAPFDPEPPDRKPQREAVSKTRNPFPGYEKPVSGNPVSQDSTI